MTQVEKREAVEQLRAKGWTYERIGQSFGINSSSAWRWHFPKGKHTVSVEPFQRRFAEMEAAPPHHRGGYQPHDAATTIAARLNWFDYKGSLDGTRVRRYLGLRSCPGTTSRGKQYPAAVRQSIRQSTAKQLCDAMGMEYSEVDL